MLCTPYALILFYVPESVLRSFYVCDICVYVCTVYATGCQKCPYGMNKVSIYLSICLWQPLTQMVIALQQNRMTSMFSSIPFFVIHWLRWIGDSQCTPTITTDRCDHCLDKKWSRLVAVLVRTNIRQPGETTCMFALSLLKKLRAFFIFFLLFWNDLNAM